MLKICIVCCTNIEPDPRVLCLYFGEGAGLLFLFKIGCHGGIIRAFALMKMVCICDAVALATQCLHPPLTQEQLWKWNLTVYLCTVNRFLKHTRSSCCLNRMEVEKQVVWQLQGLQEPQTKCERWWETPGLAGAFPRWDTSRGFDFAARCGIAGKLNPQIDGKPCLTFRSADRRVSLHHFLVSLNHYLLASQAASGPIS